MKFIKRGKVINIEWTVLKCFSKEKENFPSSGVYFFLTSCNGLVNYSFTKENGVIKVSLPATLPVGMYGVKLMWDKDNTKTKRKLAAVEELFAISEEIDDTDGKYKIKITTSVATYGYDGLSAYEEAVMLGKTTLSEAEWIANLASVSTALQGKVDKVTGKGLSSNDYTNAEKEKVDTINNKVDKVNGKGLSTNDYTDAEKTKVYNIQKKVFGNVTIDNLESSGLSTENPPAGLGGTNTFISNPSLPINTSQPIELKKGEKISIGDYPDHVGCRTICTVDSYTINVGDTSTCVAAKSGVVGSIEYTATEDCYVVYTSYNKFSPIEYTIQSHDGLVDTKVDRVTGKGLSTNDYTNADKAKVASIDSKVDVIDLADHQNNEPIDAIMPFVVKLTLNGNTVLSCGSAETSHYDCCYRIENFRNGSFFILKLNEESKKYHFIGVFEESLLNPSLEEVDSIDGHDDKWWSDVVFETFHFGCAPEAPKDGNAYVRKNGAWVKLSDLI